jgi:hypothetical protein
MQPVSKASFFNSADLRSRCARKKKVCITLLTCCINNYCFISRYFIPRDTRIQNMWIERIKNPKLLGLEPKYVGKSFVVCENHFSPICKDARGRLLKNVLPRVNLPDIIYYVCH